MKEQEATVDPTLHGIFSIWDAKLQAYMQPFFAVNEAVAVRAFEVAAMNPQHTMHSHPGDFTLFQVGEFDEKSGEISDVMPSRAIVQAIHLPFWQREEK